jgi:hypothetical protein
MDRVKKLLQLIPKELQQDRFALESARTAMDDHPSRLENGHKILVLVNHLDRLL